MTMPLFQLVKRLGRPLKRLLRPRAPKFTPGPETLIFVHVPKAAGSTLNTIIRDLYGRDAICHINGYRTDSEGVLKLRGLPAEQRRKIKVLCGHIPFGLHDHVPQPFTYVTIVRDPVERIISYYYYVARRPDHFHHQVVAGGKMSLAEYIELPHIWVHDAQAKIFAGFDSPSLPPRDLLALAMDNLAQYFAVVGLTERFDETLARIGRHMNWPPISYQPTNVTKDRPKQTQISPALLDRIRELNQLDLELYDWAVRRFERQSWRQAA
jgi:hypothetical protein